MKLPRPFTGWVSSKGKAHETQEAAMAESVKEELFRVLYDEVRKSHHSYHLSPETVVDVVQKHFNISPKVVTE
jgi:hypothetical protein